MRICVPVQRATRSSTRRRTCVASDTRRCSSMSCESAGDDVTRNDCANDVALEPVAQRDARTAARRVRARTHGARRHAANQHNVGLEGDEFVDNQRQMRALLLHERVHRRQLVGLSLPQIRGVRTDAFAAAGALAWRANSIGQPTSSTRGATICDASARRASTNGRRVRPRASPGVACACAPDCQRTRRRARRATVTARCARISTLERRQAIDCVARTRTATT